VAKGLLSVPGYLVVACRLVWLLTAPDETGAKIVILEVDQVEVGWPSCFGSRMAILVTCSLGAMACTIVRSASWLGWPRCANLISFVAVSAAIRSTTRIRWRPVPDDDTVEMMAYVCSPFSEWLGYMIVCYRRMKQL